jgi:hypothetical protein
MNTTRTKRQAIIVAGMHRSGTSSVAGALVALGGSAPSSLMSADAANPKGYWESTRLMDLNDQILTSAGTYWNDWRAFNPDWYDTPLASHFHAKACEALEQEFPDSPLFILKDPRVCRILPFWLQVLDELKIAAHVVMPLRNPIEVAMSLAQRDGMSMNLGMLLWLRHVLDAEYFSRDTPRATLLWDEFLDDPIDATASISEKLGIKWPKQRDFANLDLSSFVSSTLKRQRDPRSSRIPSRGQIWDEVYQTLASLSSADSPETVARLDEIRRKFEAASEVFGPLLAASERALQSTSTQISSFEANATPSLEDTLSLLIHQQQGRPEIDALKDRINQLEQAAQFEERARTEAADQQAAFARQLSEREAAHTEILSRLQEQHVAETETLKTRLDELDRALSNAAMQSEQQAKLAASHQEKLHEKSAMHASELDQAAALLRQYQTKNTELDAQVRILKRNITTLAEHANPTQFVWALDPQNGSSDTGSSKVLGNMRRAILRPLLPIYIWRANRARDTKIWSVAARRYASTLVINPETSDIWVQFGHALKETGLLPHAELAYRRALHLDEFNPDTHVQLGHILKLMGQTEAARQAYVRSLAINPDQQNAREELQHLQTQKSH